MKPSRVTTADLLRGEEDDLFKGEPMTPQPPPDRRSKKHTAGGIRVHIVETGVTKPAPGTPMFSGRFKAPVRYKRDMGKHLEDHETPGQAAYKWPAFKAVADNEGDYVYTPPENMRFDPQSHVYHTYGNTIGQAVCQWNGELPTCIKKF